MKVKLLFFARFRELFGISELDFNLQHGGNVMAVLDQLAKQFGVEIVEPLKAKNTLYAINLQIVTLDSELAEGDELAFMPPVTGG